LALQLCSPVLAAEPERPERPDASDSGIVPTIPVGPSDPPEDPVAKESVELEPIVVVGTRTPRAVSDQVGSVAVVSDRDIEYRQASSLGEVFRNLPGVATEGGPRANAEFVNVRGLSGPRVLLVVDGARQNFLGGHRSSLLVEPDLLKQVELLRGPASAIWGSDALGGVVVVGTKDASDLLEAGERLAGRLRMGFESSAGEGAGSGIAAGRLGDFDFIGSFSQRASDDYALADGSRMPHSALDTQGALGKLSWLPAGPHSLSLSHQDFQQAGQSPSNPATEVTDTNPLLDRTNGDRYTTLSYGFASGENGWLRAAQLNLYRSDLVIREDRVIAPRKDLTLFKTDGAGGHFSMPFDFGTEREPLFTLGAEAFQDSAHATRDGQPRPQFPDAERTIGGAFAQAEVPLGRITVVPGLRYDRYHAESNTTGAAPVDEAALSPKLGLTYELFDGVKLRGSYGAAFRAPALIEIYAAGQHFLGNNFVPNPDLRPETARNLEAGLSLELPGFGEDQAATLGGSIYRNRIDDFIELFVAVEEQLVAPQCAPPAPAVGCVNRNDDGSANPAVPPIFIGGTTSSRNLPSATLDGGEIEAAYAWGPFKLGTAYSRVRGRNDDDGQPLLSMPADRLRTTLDLRLFGSLMSSLGHTHHARQDRVPTFVDEDGNEQQVVPATPAHDVWDFSLSYEPSGSTGSLFGMRSPRLVLGVDNLTNEDYRDHLNVLRSPGRNLRASVSLGF
jgi:hemoglobin/transferrin/lactoferrin receptor protein